jgi:RHS repeat-associated protein
VAGSRLLWPVNCYFEPKIVCIGELKREKRASMAAKKSVWIPVAAFLVASVLAVFAGPSLGSSSRSSMYYTGKRYKCSKCDDDTGQCVSKDSDTKIPGWDCTENNPVNFLTGANFFSQRDLGTSGLSGFTIKRNYVQDPTWSDNAMGPGWRIGWLLRIIPNAPQLWVVSGNSPLASFTDNGNGTYSADFDYVQGLVADTVNHLLILTDAQGKQCKFFDFSANWNPARQGRLKEYDDRGGNITTTIYGTSGVTLDQLLEVQQTDTNANIFHRFDFAYNLSGASIGLLASITYSQTNTGVTTTVRVANYSYYTSSGPNGPAGTLQRVWIADGSGNTLDTSYYRYNALDATGWPPLRYAVQARAYGRMLGALGSDAAIDAASDATVATYADYFFVYDTNHRVTQETVQGQGCGCGSAGSKGVFGYAYATSASLTADAPNVWRNKCTVTLPDGNLRIVYTNSVGQTMLDVFKDATSGLQWCKYFLFNSDNSLASITFPSGVTGFTEGTDGLVSSAQLPDAAGLWLLLDYYSTTNLGTGAVAKYLQDWKVKQGELGAPILQSSYTFASRTGSSGTIYPVATWVKYRNTDGSGAQTTSFSYTWQGTTTEIAQVTTSYPIVTTAQNGSGAATSTIISLDAFGRMTSLQDEDGFVDTGTYSTLTGALTQTIEDTNNLHLVTSIVVDPLGRATQQTDPLGHLTYSVYNDPQHQVRNYPGWTGSTTTGPTTMTREDRAGGYVETLSMSAPPHVTGGAPDGTEAVSGLQSLIRNYLDTGTRVTNTDSYFNFTGLTYSTAPNIGTLGTNYYRRSYNYDVKGRSNRDQDWTGTIRRTFYDSRDRGVSTWIGTNDTPASGDWSPTNNTAPSNMIQVTGSQYDSGGVGDGLLTQSSDYTSAGTTLNTAYQYDFRRRLTNQRRPDSVAVLRTYDNLGNSTLLQAYVDSNANFVIDPGELRGQGQTNFDEKGQVYQQVKFNVDPSAGTLGDSLTTNFWRNGRGMIIKTRGPNGEFQKFQYDGVRRTTASFISFDDAETTYALASTVASDRVVDETVTTYDAASNAIQTTRYQRASGSSQTGDLATSWAASKSRRTFVARWFDLDNRMTDVADYGTNAGVAFTRPSTPPAPNSSDTILVMHSDFDAGGRQYKTTDNLAHVTQKTFDGLARVTQIVENFTGTGIPVETDLDANRTTNFLFDSSGRLSQQTALNPKGSGAGVESQTTQYVYGTIANLATPPVYRNDILVARIYPDSDDTYNPAGAAGSQLGNGTDGVYDRVEFTYDYASRKSTAKDQRGVVHTYAYDSVGRFSSDTVTTVPSGVDGSILRMGKSYDSLSRAQFLTSYSDTGGTTVVSQVKETYDGWGNVIKDEQEHVGAVVSGTTASYQVAFSDGGSGGVGKYVRPVSATYPNGRQVFYNYPAAGSTSVGDHLSRVDNVANDSAGTSMFAQYTYLGVNVFGQINHPLVTNGLQLLVATGGNPAQWDNFGRVLDQEWKATTGTVIHDRYKHTYDRDSNRLTRDTLATGAPTTQDQYYVYDNLNRLTEMNRGKLVSGVITDATATFSQKWTALESQGNWRGFQVAPTGANNYTFQQTRSHDKANEIDTDNNDANNPGNSISGTGGADWIDPTYDKAGNATTVPVPGSEATGYFTTFDAWNRLVKVQNGTRSSPGSEVAEFQYDARGWRVVKLAPIGSNWNRTDYYYSTQWQCVEERTLSNTASKTTKATVPHFQWVWDLRYVDAVILRDENKDGDNSCTGAADQRNFYTQDANFNTTALVSTAGAVVERYVYDAYGTVTVLNGSWAAQAPTTFNNEILFAGYRKDPETQLYDVRNRSYHSSLGRWLQRDSMEYVDGGNLYEYVRSSPEEFQDPLGLMTLLPQDFDYDDSKCKDCCCLIIILQYDPTKPLGAGAGDGDSRTASNADIEGEAGKISQTDGYKKKCEKRKFIKVTDVRGAGGAPGFGGLRAQIKNEMATKPKAEDERSWDCDTSKGIKQIIIVGHGNEDGIIWPTPGTDSGGTSIGPDPRFKTTKPAPNAKDEPLDAALLNSTKGMLKTIDLHACKTKDYAGKLEEAMKKLEPGFKGVTGPEGDLKFPDMRPPAPKK